MGQETSHDARTYKAGLGSPQVKLLATSERERRLLLTTDELREQVGDKVAKDVARGLVAKGVLQRVRRGRYLIRSFRTLLWPTTPSTAVAASALLQNQSHYLGGPWAASLKAPLRKAEHRSLIDDAVRGSQPSTCQRLGVLLERAISRVKKLWLA